jgi:hypothetical protein
MKKFSGIKGLAGIALAFLLLSSVPASAGTCTITATPGQALNWATWQKPSSGSPTADVTTSDSTAASTGAYLYGTAVHAAISYTTNGGNCSGTITITASDAGGASGVTLSNFHLNYNGSAITSGQSGLVLPGGGKTLLIGATATYTSAVSTGTEAPKILIHVLESGHSATNDTTITGSIGFDVPITFNKLSDINFGTVSANTVSTYRISTVGATSVVSGAGQFFTGTPTAGNITIIGSSTDGITIQATLYTADQGVTPSNATCSYNGGASANCSSASITGVAPGSGKTLLVGVDVAADGTQAIGVNATPSFTLNVNYQ